MPTASPYHVTYLDFISTAISDIEHNLLSAFISRMGRDFSRPEVLSSMLNKFSQADAKVWSFSFSGG
jgi:hypothetical protein